MMGWMAPLRHRRQLRRGQVSPFADSIRASGPSGLHQQAGHMTARPRGASQDLLPGGGHPHMSRGGKHSANLTRRHLLEAGLAASLVATGVRAQEPGRVYRLGAVHAARRDAPHHVAFRGELARLGFVERQNLIVDEGGFGLRPEQFEEHAAELVRSEVDAILAGGDAAIRAAQRATQQIPILGVADDMVGQGFVRSLAKPGGNTTGVTILASELDEKRQNILIEAIPGAERVAALVDTGVTAPWRLTALDGAARARGVALSIHRVTRRDEIVAAIEAAKASGAGALNVLASSLFFNNRDVILDRTAALRLPAIYQWPEMADEGGLLGYGPRIVQLYRDIQGRQLAKLLRGAKPADIPVEQPTKYVLVVNLRTARSLGLNVPDSLLARADEVIE
jgi:putative ABC transport system substrate-binding protein